MACFWSHLRGVRQECPTGYRYFRMFWHNPYLYSDYGFVELVLRTKLGGSVISLVGATATSSDGIHPGYAIDGDVYTEWSYMPTSLIDLWLQIDLGAGRTAMPGAYSITKASGGAVPGSTWKFQASNDATNWETLQDVINLGHYWDYYSETVHIDLSQATIP